jgi:hypothetical protein
MELAVVYEQRVELPARATVVVLAFVLRDFTFNVLRHDEHL